MTKVRTAAVIGGGISGPVAAMALRKAGIEATVYEAYPAAADGIGGSLAIADNGMAALDIVGAREAVAAAAQPLPKMMMSVNGKAFELPSLADVGTVQLVRRGALHRALRDTAAAQGIRFDYGRRLQSVDESARSATLHFADGGREEADVVIGADGIRSTVRRLIDPAAPGATYTGLLGFEGFARHDVPTAPDTMVFAFGRRAYYIYWSVPGGGTTWGANLPYPKPLPLVEARTVPAAEWMRTLCDTYGPDTPGGDLARHTAPEDLQVVGALYIMPSVPHWHRGRMVLVGDAAHAPSNSSGQGASLAIESAIQIARCLRDLPDVPTAFAAYEHLRRKRVEGVAARAARINRAKAPGPVARTFMSILLPLIMKAAMNPEKSVGPELRYRIDWEQPVGHAADPGTGSRGHRFR